MTGSTVLVKRQYFVHFFRRRAVTERCLYPGAHMDQTCLLQYGTRGATLRVRQVHLFKFPCWSRGHAAIGVRKVSLIGFYFGPDMRRSTRTALHNSMAFKVGWAKSGHTSGANIFSSQPFTWHNTFDFPEQNALSKRRLATTILITAPSCDRKCLAQPLRVTSHC